MVKWCVKCATFNISSSTASISGLVENTMEYLKMNKKNAFETLNCCALNPSSWSLLPDATKNSDLDQKWCRQFSQSINITTTTFVEASLLQKSDAHYVSLLWWKKFNICVFEDSHKSKLFSLRTFRKFSLTANVRRDLKKFKNILVSVSCNRTLTTYFKFW